MSDYINFHERSLPFKVVVRTIINISVFLPLKIFIFFWNISLKLIGNSVRVKETNKKTLLVFDDKHEIEIGYKKRFEFYMQNISHRFEHLSYEYMFSLIDFNDEDKIIDCGANIGEIYMTLKYLYSDLNFQYFGFEPNKKDFEILQRNTNNLITRPLALYSEITKKEFFLKGNTADSSFESSMYSKKDIVDCVTVDSIFTNNKNIKLFKLEAEGFEYEVIKGAKRNLKYIEYISADLSFELNNNTKSSFVEVNNYLLKNNFSLVDENPRLVYLYKNNDL